MGERKGIIEAPVVMRGYFGMGVESISKSGNLGNLLRSAHAFGASFFFTVDSQINDRERDNSDTSHAIEHLPYYNFSSPTDLQLPKECKLVGVELMDGAVNLPKFHHPLAAAYVLGPELGSLSPAMVKRCDYVVKIPTRFCVNVGVAGAIVMYDRVLRFGK